MGTVEVDLSFLLTLTTIIGMLIGVIAGASLPRKDDD